MDEFAAGAQAFAAGQYFDAHEHWETLWNRTPGPERTFLQGLIQLSVALHHRSRGNDNGFRRVGTRALEKLESPQDPAWNIDSPAVAQNLARLLGGDAFAEAALRHSFINTG